MRSRGPLITLLAGLALAGMLITLSVNASREAELTGARANAPAAGGADSADLPADAAPPGDEDAAADPEAEPADEADEGPTGDSDEDAAPAAPAGSPEVTWAGRLKGGGATVAITRKGDQAIAYICDGDDVEVWLQGTAADGKLDLSAKEGTDSLTGTFGGGRAKGTVTVDDKTFRFDVARANKPSGLYRSTATVRGAKLVGGWIVLADGTQVGLATFAGSTIPAPKLDVATRTVTVYGERVTANPAAPGDLW